MTPPFQVWGYSEESDGKREENHLRGNAAGPPNPTAKHNRKKPPLPPHPKDPSNNSNPKTQN